MKTKPSKIMAKVGWSWKLKGWSYGGMGNERKKFSIKEGAVMAVFVFL